MVIGRVGRRETSDATFAPLGLADQCAGDDDWLESLFDRERSAADSGRASGVLNIAKLCGGGLLESAVEAQRNLFRAQHDRIPSGQIARSKNPWWTDDGSGATIQPWRRSDLGCPSRPKKCRACVVLSPIVLMEMAK